MRRSAHHTTPARGRVCPEHRHALKPFSPKPKTRSPKPYQVLSPRAKTQKPKPYQPLYEVLSPKAKKTQNLQALDPQPFKEPFKETFKEPLYIPLKDVKEPRSSGADVAASRSCAGR